MKDIARLIGEIEMVATLINLKSIEQKESPQVFTRNSAHVKTFEIDVYMGGWSSNCKPKFNTEINYEIRKYNSKHEIRKKLNKSLNTLRKIYKNGKVNYSNFDYEIEEVKHYNLY